MKLDHVILRVPDIAAAHRALLDLGFREAWPVGPFWRPHLTSGIHLGGLNLELFQPAEGLDKPYADTLVFAGDPPPGYRIDTKTESDPDLLRLRGFSGQGEETICTNGFPVGPDSLDHFYCRYSPELGARLDVPKTKHGKVTDVELQLRPGGTERIEDAWPRLTIREGRVQRVLAIRIGTGRRVLSPKVELGLRILV